MSYYVVYVNPDGGTRDGDQIATGAGWLTWGEYALDRADEYPEAAHLAQEGWLGRPEDLDDLEHELETLAHADDRDVGAISGNLLAAVRARPDGTEGILVTDGTEPDGDDDE